MCDSYILHDGRLDDLKVINLKCDIEVNKTGSLTFYIAPTHPYYDKIKKHTSEITLYQDDKMLFSGRVLNDEIDFDNIKLIECEGELAYLIDSIQRGKEYHLSGDNAVETYLNDVISIHNSQVEERKQFSVGLVNIKDSNDYLYKISNYENTLSVLNDKLLSTYGGYLMVRHADGVRYIDYISELTNICTQKIEFGKNIVDMTKFIKGEDIYTALIPLGAKLDPESTEIVDRRLTISSLNDELDGTIQKTDDYIYDLEGVKQWGWIWRTIKWDDVTVASNLLSKAKSELKEAINSVLTIELTAIDLHLLDVKIDRINIGDRIQCVSLPHNLNTIMVVKSMSIDIDNPANTTIKLVSPTTKLKAESSITTGNKDNEKNILDVKDTLNDGYPTYDDLNTKLSDFELGFNNAYDDIKDWASNSFLPMGADGNVDLRAYAKIADVNNAFNELALALEGV